MVNFERELYLELCDTLRKENYLSIQYIPTRKNRLAIFKEPENLINLFKKKKHLLFYYSLFPQFYLWIISYRNPKLKILINFCYFNIKVSQTDLLTCFSEKFVIKILNSKSFEQSDGLIEFKYNIVPFLDYFIIRDSLSSYASHELYEISQQVNRVWMGPDSTKFASLNKFFLKGRIFQNALELGSGTGIQLLALSHQCKQLVGVDINERAVAFSQANIGINNVKNINVLHSDLFQALNEKFDLILANPWFIDLEKSGMEEIPDIFSELDQFITPKGIFTMYFTSYVKLGVDIGVSYLSKFAKKNTYNATFKKLGSALDSSLHAKFVEYGISHSVTYFVILEKDGQGVIKMLNASFTRRIRDVIQISLSKIRQRLK